ncbi:MULTISPECIES: DUF2267 domain-containing protein [unclassified Streptomyces]|uniref:DUF2267 domain-containing protein n=1 Tax=unclassified Streptomyces TaxID=2593676 RepID=UPI00081F53F0|nr:MULTISPECIES: DUF2267 domain-containing protein [unclassified Streptomyces]MYZ34230.1 DUF2267 domain-containing protein [Streptomyces sp. SID4917]SCF65223.1 Uncharacterized conserved protein, DUF2267 family [Streptomyces sp. MnatMP-M17]
MVDTGFSSFDTMVDKANHILKEIEKPYGWPKERRKQSYAALRAVLHQLRDRLSVEESAQFAAQLPTLLRGIYYDGWKPAETPVKMHKEEFLERVKRDFRYSVDGGTEQLVHTVLTALQQHISEGEWKDLKAHMPTSLAAVLPDGPAPEAPREKPEKPASEAPR